jgi:hypothetical protein
VACFVPKAHTPFQWARQDTAEELIRKQALLRGAIHARAIHLSCHDTRRSLLEGVLARGGRDLGPVILSAYRAGCVLDAWDEQFDFARWEAAFAGHGRSLQAEASRDWDEGAPLPWRHIDCGVSEAFLRREARLARESRVTPDCREGKCVACGVRAIAGECPERPGCPPDGSDQSR